MREAAQNAKGLFLSLSPYGAQIDFVDTTDNLKRYEAI